MKRLPFTDAFVDESVRGRRYLMACVMAEARHLPELRPLMRALAVHDRVHFNNESQRRKRLVLGAIADMLIGVFIAVAHRGHGISEFLARNACLVAVVEHVQQRDVPRLVIENRDDDRKFGVCDRAKARYGIVARGTTHRFVVNLRANRWLAPTPSALLPKKYLAGVALGHRPEAVRTRSLIANP